MKEKHGRVRRSLSSVPPSPRPCRRRRSHPGLCGPFPHIVLPRLQAPGLAVVIVGTRKDSQSYVRMKRKACAEVGIVSFDKRARQPHPAAPAPAAAAAPPRPPPASALKTPCCNPQGHAGRGHAGGGAGRGARVQRRPAGGRHPGAAAAAEAPGRGGDPGGYRPGQGRGRVPPTQHRPPQHEGPRAAVCALHAEGLRRAAGPLRRAHRRRTRGGDRAQQHRGCGGCR